MTEERRPSKFAFILHADIAGSTALVQRDEQVAHDRIQDTFRRFGDIIAQYHGHVRELRGDALLAEFERASDAVSATLAFQVNQDEYTAQLNDNILPMVRVGIAMGEVVVADNTVTGEGVVLAQRVEQLADPGSVCITGAIHEALPSRMPFDQDDLGEQEVKGFDELVRVYTVRLRLGTELPEPTIASATKRTSAMQWTMVGIVVVLICGGGLLAWVQPWKPDFEPASVEEMAFPLPDKPSIAVLAFDNLSREPDAERFSDGISENIITVLSKIPELFVIARNSSFTYKGKAVPTRQVAEDFGVRYVLEGSLQKEGERIRITAQLIDALSGSHLWAETYDRTLDDFFAVQDEITLSIVKSLQNKLVLGETWNIPKQSVDNLQAWELITKAEWYFRKTTKENNAEARALALEAIELDPGSARAYSLLGWTHVRDAQFRWGEDSNRSAQLAEEFARKTLTIDDTTAGAYTLLGRIYGLEQRYEDAIAVQERALEFGPNDPGTWGALALTKLYAGYPEEAVALSKKAERLYPTIPASWLNIQSFGYYLLGRYEDALSVTRRQLARQPERTRTRLFAIASHIALDQTEQARADVEFVLEHTPDFSVRKWADKYLALYKDTSFKEPLVTRLVEAGLPEHPPLKLPDKPSLAVLAFDNLSGDPEKEYMADGISEHIISTLARLPQLFIVSRNSTFYYKGKAVDVRQVAEELGVQYVLEGSLQTSGDSVRITAQLIDALSGLHVWSEHYDRSVDDFFALQDDITHKIAVALQVELTRGEQALIETQTTTNLKAWLKFQQAFEAYGAFTPDGNRLARKLLHEAVELDPYFAQAWTFLGWTHFIDARLGYSESRTESLTKSNELVDKAASVHPELPELYLLRAFLHMIEGELDEAIILGRKLLEVAPGSSNYHAGNAMIMLYAGEFEASIEFMQKAKRLSPLGRTWYDLVLGRAYLLKRDYESAAATFERITTEDTSPVIAAGGHTSMAVLYMETGWEDKARKEIEKALSRASWLSISFYRRVAHYKDPANWWRFETALANAGLPE